MKHEIYHSNGQPKNVESIMSVFWSRLRMIADLAEQYEGRHDDECDILCAGIRHLASDYDDTINAVIKRLNVCDEERKRRAVEVTP